MVCHGASPSKRLSIIRELFAASTTLPLSDSKEGSSMIQSDPLALAIEAMRADPQAVSSEPFIQLVAALRPRHPQHIEDATHRIRALTLMLGLDDGNQAAVRQYVMALLGQRRLLHLLADAGILANQGFWSALRTRLGAKVLPEEHRDDYMLSVLGQAFHASSDYRWVGAVAPGIWLDLWRSLAVTEAGHRREIRSIELELIEAAQVLSYRISAIGLEPELVRVHPSIERFESPFLTQNVAVRDYLERYKARLVDDALVHEDDSHVQVLLGQCDEIEGRVRKTMAREGVSVSLTYLMVRLRQHLDRLRLLLALLDPAQAEMAAERTVGLFYALVEADNRKTSLRDLFATNTDMLALQITQHAGRTGEHYIAADRAEWKVMARSATGAGVIVGFMALFKILLAKLKLAPLIEAFAFSMNYSLGFMLVHVLHFTIATKQPAMTAARIAASVDAGQGKGEHRLDSLVDLIEAVARTQFIAIVCNACVALSTAFAIALFVKYGLGQSWVTVEKAHVLLHDLDPFRSLAVLHAAIAGVCLFLSGLISGYYDNMAVYNRIPARLWQLQWPRRLFGEPRWRRICDYVENNLGALAGNFFFGIMLGSLGTVGFLLGLPLDIRHITFSSAYLAYAAVALNFQLDWQTWATSLLGIGLIGLTNLAVSFSLALFVAMRARGGRLAYNRELIGKLFRRLRAAPKRFFIAPVEAVEPQAAPVVE
jgi:site-specific recombinase